MRVSRTLFALGLVAYLASFFLVGVYGFDGPVKGYVCARMALWVPLDLLERWPTYPGERFRALAAHVVRDVHCWIG